MFKRKLNENMDDTAQISKQAKFIDGIHPEGRTFKYDFMTSLQNIVLAKIISYLWMNRNIQNEIVNLFRSHVEPGHQGFPEKWLQIQSTIFSQVSELFLPNALIKRLRNIIPVIGNCLLNWIRYHDEYVMKSWQNSKYSAVDFISHIAWTTRGKIDYAQTAKNILANNSISLNDVQKYEIACTYCFVDKISLLSHTIDDRYYLSIVSSDLNPMVQFWASYFNRNDKLYNPYGTIQHNKYNGMIYKHVMWLLTNNNRSVKQTLNEIPIIYVWNKLNREDRAKCVVPLIKKIGSQDFIYSILSNLDYEQQQQVFKECSDSILVGILNDWLWEDFFLPNALQVLDILDPIHYLKVLEEVIEKKKKNFEENKYTYLKFKSIFRQLWEEGSRCLKDFICEHENGHSIVHLVTISLSFESDLDIIELILNDLTSQQKRKLILEWHGIKCCSRLIQNDHWDFLELFIKYTLSCEEDVTRLKHEILLEEGHRIALHLFHHKSLDKIEEFLHWSFKSEEEKNKFRQDLAYSAKMYLVILESINSSNKVYFKELEHYIQWCAKNDPEVLKRFKEEIPECPAVIKLMKKQKYELVDQVLSWCFSENQKQIASYKSNMYKDDRFSESITLLILNLIKEDKSFKMLDEFTSWSFTNENEVQEFKAWILHPVRTSADILLNPFTDLLYVHNFDMTDKFINWCVNSSEAVSTFKNEYMLSTAMFYILSRSRRYHQDHLKLLINWFDPSRETVEKFKTLFSKDDFPHNFFELLDEYIEGK